MRKRMLAPFPPSAPIGLFLCAATAVQGGSLESMKLLTPRVGWAATSNQLFWTADTGVHWKDVTPKTGSDGGSSDGDRLASVFFLDASRGWVLLVNNDDQATEDQDPRFSLASTANAGDSWSITHLEIPDSEPGRGLSDNGWVDFADPLHGWVMVRMNGNTAVSTGVLLATRDGGRSWHSPKVGPP